MMSFKHSLLALSVASALALTGCSGGSSGPSDPRLDIPDDAGDQSADETEQQTFCSSSTTSFEVTEFVPADGATDVAVNSNIRITFNANVDAESVDGHVRLLIDGVNPVELEEGSPRVVGRSIVLNPLGDLAADSAYTIQADSELQADCEDTNPKPLAYAQTSSFSTAAASEQDTTGPTITAASPETGETLAPEDARLYVEFDEPIDPTSVNDTNFVVTELDDEGNEVGTVSGVLNVIGNSIEFTPDSDLNGQTFYKYSVGTSITDLAGNALTAGEEYTFRTGGLILALNDGLVSQIPLLGDGLNLLGGTLLEPLGLGDAEDGLSNLDNALILKVPLVDGLQSLADGGADNFTDPDFTNVNGVDFAEYASAAIAVCDPKSYTELDDGSPSVDCTLGLDLGLDVTELAALADAFTGGDPTQVPDLLLGLVEGLSSGDLSALPPELASLFEEDGLGISLKLVDDDGLPLPEPLEDALVTVLDTVAQLPVLGTLVNQEEGKPLVDVGLLEGELLGVSAGDLATVGVLSGLEEFIGPNGVLNLGDTLFETLLELAPTDFGEGDTPAAEDLPLIGDLLTLLDAGNFFEGDVDPESVPIIGSLASLFELEGDITPEDIPVIGEALSVLNPETITEGDIPVIGDLIDQLLALEQDNPLEDLPLVGDLLELLESGASDDENPLSDILDPDALTNIPVLGELFDALPFSG